MNGSSVMRNSARLCSDAVRWTRARNGMVDTSPLSTSSRLIRPPCDSTMAPPSAVQEYPGMMRVVFMPSAASCVIGSMITRSLPVSRSRSHSALRGPKRCPLNEIVPFGIRRAKASQRPSGEISGPYPPPLEARICCAARPAVIEITSPVSRSFRRSCQEPASASRPTRPGPSYTWK